MRTPSCGLLFGLLVASKAMGLAQASEIRIGTGEFPPYSTKKTADHGCAIKIVKSAYEAEGWTVDFQFMPWPRNLNLLSRGEIDASAYWAKRADRIEQYIFPKNPVTSEAYSFVFPKNAIIQWDSYSDLRRKKIITNKSYTYSDEFFAALKEFDIENYVVRTEKQSLSMLLRGRADLAIMNGKVFKKYLDQLSEAEQSRLYLDPKPALEVNAFPIFSRSDIEKARKLAEVFDNGYEKIRNKVDLQKSFETCGF